MIIMTDLFHKTRWLYTPSDMDDIPANSNHLQSTLINDLPTVSIISFGIRNGPLNPPPDLSIDLRSLPNPPKNTRTGHTGLSSSLREWLFSDAVIRQRFQHVCRQIQECLDDAKAYGKTQVVVGVNCQIGRHRSVAVVEELGRLRFDGWNVIIGHRDVHRDLKRTSQKHRLRQEQVDHEVI